jgi:thiamine biosynthesis protein ThiS
MTVNVVLYSSLRLLLPPEKNGKGAIEIHDQATLQDLLDHLGIQGEVAVSVNDEIVTGRQISLQHNDTVQVFRPVGGG